VRVGIAFAPAGGPTHVALTEDVKMKVLEDIAAAFRGREVIADIRVIPSIYVKPYGGYEDLDRIAAAFGVDLAVLISYDQAQFSESGAASLAYWTLIGAYFVSGEKQQTRTVLDAAVIDIESRAGESRSAGAATPVSAGRELREGSEEGFRSAAADLVAKLDTALGEFQKQAASGTVRGPGTPAIELSGPGAGPGGGSGGGAAGVAEIALASLVAGAGLAAWRRRKA
jgi:rhombotail lipoprotein